MNSTLLSVAALGVASLVTAQSPLNVAPVAPVGYYGWNTPPPIHTNLFNLTVSTQVTLQAISTPLLTPVGVVGHLEVWLTNAGTTTYVGNETNQAVWHLAASGQIVGLGTTGSVASLTATSCQSFNGAGLVINPGSYGVLIRYTSGTVPLLVAVGTPQTFSNAELTVSGGAIQYTPWTAVQPAAGGAYTAWAWRGSIIYQNGTFPHACAETTKYGAGCYTVGGSAYEEWTDNAVPSAAAAASAALTGRKLTFLPAGSGYVMLGGSAAGSFIPPSPTATALPATDDNENAINLTVPFAYPGGVTSQLFVNDNGYVSAGPVSIPAAVNFIPEIPAMLAATNTTWYSWHDYNPAEVGSGVIKYEEVGNVMVITWDNVESWPATAVNPSTIQFQFDEIAGTVTIVWQAIEAIGGTGVLQGSDHIIGYSPGGPSPDTGPIDITTLTSMVLPFPEKFSLALDSSAKPLIGTTINLNTSANTPNSLGINFVSLVQIPAPGFDLGVIGAPGCAALLDINQGVGNVITDLPLPGLSLSVAFPLPNNPTFAGISIFSQSIWLDPTVNAFGALVSNGLSLKLGNF
jgi:hypothetical protein